MALITEKKLIRAAFFIEVILLFLSGFLMVALHVQKVKSKATLFVDAARNDFFYNDVRALQQKIQSAVAGHEFSAIEFLVGDRKSEHHKQVLQYGFALPLFASTSDPTTIVGEVYFVYSLKPPLKEGLVVWGIFSIFFLLSLPFFKRSIEKQVKADLEAHYNKQTAELTRMVAHDIRSPLAVLTMLADRFRTKLPKESQMLTVVCQRIKVIADELLDSSKRVGGTAQEKFSDPVLHEMPSVILAELLLAIENVVEEKRVQAGGSDRVTFTFSNQSSREGSCLVSADLEKFKRIVSNLLNNAIESIPLYGSVSVKVLSDVNRFYLEIRDSGKGMTEALIQRLNREPASEGKEKGSGLGVYPAIHAVSAWGGKLEIQSQIGTGTTVFIELNLIE